MFDLVSEWTATLLVTGLVGMAVILALYPHMSL